MGSLARNGHLQSNVRRWSSRLEKRAGTVEFDVNALVCDMGQRTALSKSRILIKLFIFRMGAFAPDRKAYEVFDTQNRDERGSLCYKYEGLPASTYLI
jgi:hypothetical protein